MGSIRYELRKLYKKPNKENEEETPDKTRAIFLVYWHNGTRFVYSVGQRIDIDLWSKNNNRAKKRKGRTDLSLLNSLLDKHEKILKEVEYNLHLEKKPVTNADLKAGMDLLLGKAEPKKEFKSFIEYGDHLVKLYRELGKSHKAIHSAIRLIEQFRPNLTFEEVDAQFHDDLVIYMKNTPYGKDKRYYTKNYIGKVIAGVKLIMNRAIEDGYTNSVKHRASRFKRTKEKVYNIYLSMDELKKLHKHKFDQDYLDNACDLFLLGALTGLRYGDYSDLKGVNFSKGEFIVQKTMKTDTQLVIPQHKIVKEILDKRNGELPHSISNVKLNKYIKTVGEKAGINQEVTKIRTEGKEKVRTTYKKYELITTHTARRSLATNMYLAGIPIKTIMTITGHATVAQLMDYIKITEIEVAESLKDHPFFKH